MLKVSQILKLEVLKLNLETVESGNFANEIRRIYEQYQEVQTDNAFIRDFEKAQKGFLKELEEIAVHGIKNSVEWHRTELLNYIDELIAYCEY